MTDPDLTLKPGVVPDERDLATIASAFKALAVYDLIARDHDDDPEELRRIVDEGLAVLDRLFV
jgi:hypothetical protein